MESCVICNITEEDGNFMPMKFSLYSWVTMQPSLRGCHHVKKAHIDDRRYHWKGKIVDFKWDSQRTSIAEVHIQHVYKVSEIWILSDLKKSFTPNYKLLSIYLI